jgi:superfamily II DNA or RNA helicase
MRETGTGTGTPQERERGVTLRPYQYEALDAIETTREEEGNAALFVLPTGTGKTVVLCGHLRW